MFISVIALSIVFYDLLLILVDMEVTVVCVGGWVWVCIQYSTNGTYKLTNLLPSDTHEFEFNTNFDNIMIVPLRINSILFFIYDLKLFL